MAVNSNLTEEDIQLYDRQIRAWGVEAQKRMRESRILVVGLDGAGSETLKNLVLAGLGNITIMENTIVSQSTIESHFYLNKSHLKLNWAQIALEYFSEMNPNIKLSIVTDDPFLKNNDFYQSFDVVIVNNHCRYLQLRINEICSKIAFFSARSIGPFGYIFADLQTHQFRNKTNNNETQTLQWYPLKSALEFENKALKKQLKGKKKAKYRSFMFALQVCEQLEDHILQTKVNKTNNSNLYEMVGNEMKNANHNQSKFYKSMRDIKSKIEKSGQFEESDYKMDASGMMDGLMKAWNCNVCPSNAMIGGYLANFIMFYIQKKQKPLHNFLVFDMWNCQALEMLMRNENDAKMNEKQMQKKVKAIDDVNISSLSVSADITETQTKELNQNAIVLLDDDGDEEMQTSDHETLELID